MSSMQITPVFFDQTGRRWRVARCLLILTVVGLISLPTAFVITAFTVQTNPIIEAPANDNVSAGTETSIQFGRVATKRRAH